MSLALTPQDRTYKYTVQRRIQLGANFRELRYNGRKLKLMPNIKPNGQRKQASAGGEPAGTFLETYQLWLGNFEIAESALPSECIEVGAVWEMKEQTHFRSDAEGWSKVFVLTQPIQEMLWWKITLAKFIAQANLTVTYDVPTGAYTTVDGNSVPDTTAATFTAVVSQQQRPRDIELPGTPANSIYLEGYHTAPASIITTLDKRQLLSATLDGMAGEFIVLPSAQPPIGSAAGSGDVIKGWFVVAGL